MLDGKTFRQMLDKFLISPAGQNARVQIQLPNGQHMDIKEISLLENRLLSYIGKISYGLYLYQGIFLKTGPSGILAIQQFPLNIFLTFIVAIISYEFIEKPILRYKKRFR